MGYETYLVEIRLKNNKDRELLIANLISRKFSYIENNQNRYLEKSYPTGIIEICVTPTQMMFRYAKPNLQQGLHSFLEEMEEISKICKFDLYDYNTKQLYESNHFLEIAELFEMSRKEFARYFSVEKYPVKSDEVLTK